jgi:hypothetical protein
MRLSDKRFDGTIETGIDRGALPGIPLEEGRSIGLGRDYHH